MRERGTYVWCQSLKRWARTYDRVQGGCCFTTSRYSSAISHTGGLRPSNSAGLWRFPSENNTKSAQNSVSKQCMSWAWMHFIHCLLKPRRNECNLQKNKWDTVLLTCTHNSLHSRLLNAALHITQVLNVAICKHWNIYCLPVAQHRKNSYWKCCVRGWGECWALWLKKQSIKRAVIISLRPLEELDNCLCWI